GGCEENVRGRVGWIKASILGDDHFRVEVDILLFDQFLRQLLPGQFEVGWIATQERAGFVFGVADHQRDIPRLIRRVRVERVTQQQVVVEHRSEVKTVVFYPRWIFYLRSFENFFQRQYFKDIEAAERRLERRDKNLWPLCCGARSCGGDLLAADGKGAMK